MPFLIQLPLSEKSLPHIKEQLQHLGEVQLQHQEVDYRVVLKATRHFGRTHKALKVNSLSRLHKTSVQIAMLDKFFYNYLISSQTEAKHDRYP